MTDNERLFWNRVLELAHGQLKQATFDFFVADAKLINVTHNTATIMLDSEIKELFWQKNLQALTLTAGFEIFNEEITNHYIFSEDQLQAVAKNDTSELEVRSNHQNQTLPPIESHLNNKYSFQNFVQGDENRWAVAASIAVTEGPGTTYNPLFIYGGPGLGKTHLLNAIGNTILQENPQARKGL